MPTDIADGCRVHGRNSGSLPRISPAYQAQHPCYSMQSRYQDQFPAPFAVCHFVLEPVKHAQCKSLVIPCIDIVGIEFYCFVAAHDLLFISPQFSEGKPSAYPCECKARIDGECQGERCEGILMPSFPAEGKSFKIILPPSA